jgi:hypothetical protein
VGEAEFGLKKGIISTRPGWLGKVEVVEVKFDPRVTTYNDLAKVAATKRCAEPIFACTPAQKKVALKYTKRVQDRGAGKIRWVQDNKYYMSQGALKYLPVTETQATRINAGLTQTSYWLSPGQKALLKKIKANPKTKWPTAIGQPFAKAWSAAMSVAKKLK